MVQRSPLLFIYVWGCEADRCIKSQIVGICMCVRVQEIVASETKSYVLNSTSAGFPSSGLKTMGLCGGADANDHRRRQLECGVRNEV